MEAMRHSVLPPTSLAQILLLISNLNDEQFRALKTASSGARSFELSQAVKERLSSGMQLPVDTISYVMSALSFLYRQMKPSASDSADSWQEKVESVVEDLRLAEAKDANPELLKIRISELLQYNKNHELHMKVARLEEGFIASVLSASSFVDLRPSFNAERTELDGFVPIVQMCIVTDSPKSSETQLVFQMDIQGLGVLKKAIADIDKKIDLLTGQSELFLPLLGYDKDEI